MPARAHLLRQLHLVRRLQAMRGRALPFAEIQRYLLQETSVGDFDAGYSQRTLQRDIGEITELFGITIKSRKAAGYYIAETEALLPEHARLLEAFELQDFFRLPAALAPFVQSETRRAQGLEHLRPLLRAAQAGCLVEFQYQKFWEDAAVARTAGPLLLKEFRGRWYVLAAMAGSGWLACFGLDRISDLRVTKQKFAPPADFDAATYYENAFGIIRPDAAEEAPQEIILRFSPQQGRYALAYPLHASQRVLVHNEAEIRLTLTVFDTHDLRMELLSYGPAVEVLAPAGLRRWLRAQHTEAGN
ncbi:helix-turn-helix transcriptional regulator [Hymenobacter cheonanensis]|uniref:helix-turn-helix transcriptional regulator n=1 Tax=Hymenobacter sp. CA2-7 TaxID=3063993 RepID=UPI00271265BD|nr:WYL domain-containing protein [Hymenobacter sp. CA2-7]MDO7887915.1 WYL domain-containing protein [Hymenobacter sp. CA2-7]